MAEPTPDQWRRTIRSRLLLVAGMLVLWAAVIEARLVVLQVAQHDEMVARAERQQMRSIKVPARRGDIVDREGRVLATTGEIDSIVAFPTDIDQPRRTADALCRALGDCTADFRQSLAERFDRRRSFTFVRRHVPPAQADRVRGLDLPGIGLIKEHRRYYPNVDLAAHVLGYVGIDSQGLGGIERVHEGHIRGEDGITLVHTDARRHAFDRVERPPTAGATLELTLDAVLQHRVERELAAAVAANRAEGGTAIVMDPWTGEILAMANVPTFNPNAFARSEEVARRNSAVQDIYEPGSTFKVVTASAALEEDVITPETPVDCAPGHIRVAGYRTVRDVHAYGTLSFRDVIVKSSNVGAIKVGQRLGAERLSRYVRRFGFGSALAPDLPGEQAGIVWTQLNEDALASVSMGYQIGVTPLQMAAAVSSIANGGELLEPRVVRAFVTPAGREPVARKVLRRTVTAGTAAELTEIMEAVVERGTARAAQVAGYTIAGKTGTAAKLVDGVYSKSKYMASFVGFLPSRAPRVTVLVVIDTPRTGAYFGGTVAAPVFQRIAEAAIRHLGVPPTIDPAPPVLVARARAEGPGPVPASLPARAASRIPAPTPDGVMPDLRGLSARDALRLLTRHGATPQITGRGFVVEQAPEPGAPLEPGSTPRLRLDRVPPPPPDAATTAEP